MDYKVNQISKQLKQKYRYDYSDGQYYNLSKYQTQLQNPVMKISVTPLHKIYNYILI